MYDLLGDHTVVVSDVAVPAGDDVVLGMRLRRLDGFAGTASLHVGAADAGAADLRLFMRMMSSIGPSIGFDRGSAVSARYVAPLTYTGTLHEVVIQASPERFGDGEPGDVAEATARAEMARQ